MSRWLTPVWAAMVWAARLGAETVWAPVAANPHRMSLEGVVIPAPSGPEVVRLVGPRTAEAPAPPKPVWRLGDLAGKTAAEVGVKGADAARRRAPEATAPTDAIRLESADRVYGEASSAGAGRASAAPRNPWEVRWAVRPKATHHTLVCGGILVGGEGGPVAWVNGRAVRRGDRLGPFVVEGVQREAVLLAVRGVRYLLPRGRTATIALTAP
jgi:hypothetical protein